MKVEPFQLERWQSQYEHEVEINLSDSGVRPFTLRELFGEDADRFLEERLGYTQTNGTAELRKAIADLHAGCQPSHVLVTNGGAEANWIVGWTLLEPGDEVILQTPTYMQLWGLLRAMGVTVHEWSLEPDVDADRWVADVDRLAALVTPRTRLISLCNPGNPTGARLEEGTLDAIAALAATHGAWVHCDEIYAGADLDGAESPSMWGRHDRVFITSSLSKAYGLPGLRLGWIVGPEPEIAECWARRDYTTIAPGAISDPVGTRVLGAERERILARARAGLRKCRATADAWLGTQREHLQAITPDAGAMIFARHASGISSTDLADRIRTEERVLVVPGEHFHREGWIRIGIGADRDHLDEGFERIGRVLASL